MSDNTDDMNDLVLLAMALDEAVSKVKELEAKLERAVAGLKQCKEEIDDYILHEYPQDNPLHERYRMRDYSSNPARTTLAELSSVSCANLKGQDNE